jgi:adenylate kinase
MRFLGRQRSDIVGQIYLVMGIQGSGKGTQADRLSRELGIPHISTGDIFRAVSKQQSPLGEELRHIMNAGLLVPDELTSRMVRERIAQDDAQRGFILDGYPRTREQARHLDEMLRERGEQITAVFFFDMPEEEAVARLEPRRVCTANNAHIYHMVHKPPKHDAVCDFDGAPLIQRDDDKPEAIRKRVAEYKQQTIPVAEDYEARGLVHHIDATQPIDAVTEQLMRVIKKLVKS